MMDNRIATCTALLAALLALSTQATFADDGDTLKDASFEAQLSPDDGGWVLFDQSAFSTDQARTGSRSMLNNGFSRTVPYPPFLHGLASGSYQEFAADAGSRWRLTGYGMATTALKGKLAFGIVQVSFFDSRGNDLGTVETAGGKSSPAKTSNEVNSQSPVGEWIFLDTGIATAPEGTATVQAFTLFVDYSGSETAQGVYFDDLSLCALKDNESDCTGR